MTATLIYLLLSLSIVTVIAGVFLLNWMLKLFYEMDNKDLKKGTLVIREAKKTKLYLSGVLYQEISETNRGGCSHCSFLEKDGLCNLSVKEVQDDCYKNATIWTKVD